VAAGGIEALTAAGIECEIGLCADLAAEVNDPWLTAVRRQRPYVIAKVAVTSDGFIAKPDGTSKWITGPEARAEGHRLRAEMGCVLVGRRTVEIDDPLLTARIPGVVNQPVRVVLDRSAKLAATHQVFNRDAPTIRFVGSGRSALECDVELEQFDVTSVLDALFEQGVRGVLVEGGAETLASFLRSGFVDRVERFTAPAVFGEGLEAPVPVGFELVESKKIGSDKHEVLKVLGPREQ
jgi:diaminohydroxyphosphoribosylaminopyrimidine deaminase/5-amino-6-(5-phosphoribosylamino)uracil reductase